MVAGVSSVLCSVVPVFCAFIHRLSGCFPRQGWVVCGPPTSLASIRSCSCWNRSCISDTLPLISLDAMASAGPKVPARPTHTKQ